MSCTCRNAGSSNCRSPSSMALSTVRKAASSRSLRLLTSPLIRLAMAYGGVDFILVGVFFYRAHAHARVQHELGGANSLRRET